MPDAERRGTRRVTFYAEASLEGMDVGRATVRLADLSVDGAFVDVRDPLPIGAVVGLRFRALEQEVRVRAEVRYSVPGIGVGVRFRELSTADRSVIERLVEES